MAGRVRKRALVEVEISGLGVIERAQFSPGPGLTVITGETGAGKTMVLSALSLLTGARADATVVRNGSERASVVGRFSVSDEVSEKVREIGGEVEEDEVLCSRTVTAEGKSRASVGGMSTTISTLADLGADLLSIHGQSANFTLLKPQKAREILDNFGHQEIAPTLKKYQELFERYRTIRESIKELAELRNTRERELERITTFLADFDRVNPQPMESSQLRDRIVNLENVDSLRVALANSLHLLSGEEAGVTTQIAQVKRLLEGIGQGSSQGEATIALVREISILVNELTSLLTSQEEDLDVEPDALEQMHSRRAQVTALIKKYGDVRLDNPESALIDLARRNRALFGQLSEGDKGIVELEAERDRIANELIASVQKLSQVRKSAAKELEAEISAELLQLAMPSARILIAVEKCTEGVAVTNGKISMLCSPSGGDEVTILLEPHAGATPLPINKGASGGELSRIMLAIEVVLAGHSSIPTYIFDEVDAGVGGKAAVEVGRRLAHLARHAQVLVVTHLPQVAAWADTHYSISKNSSETVTTSDLALLAGSERVQELARMMTGREESTLARQHAQELLDFVEGERNRSKKESAKRA